MTVHIEGRVGPERGTAAAGAVLMVQLPSRQQSGRVAPTECVYSQRLIAQLMRRRRCSHRIGKSLPNFCYCHCSPHSMRSLTVNGPSVYPIRPLQQHAVGLLLWARRQEISIGCCTTGAAAAIIVGSDAFTAYVGSWTEICL